MEHSYLSFHQITWSPLKPAPTDYSTGRFYSTANDCQINDSPTNSYFMDSTPTTVCLPYDFWFTIGPYQNATMVTCTDDGWTITTYNSLTTCAGEVALVLSGNSTSGCTKAGYYPPEFYYYDGFNSFRCVPPSKSIKKGSGGKKNQPSKKNALRRLLRS